MGRQEIIETSSSSAFVGVCMTCSCANRRAFVHFSIRCHTGLVQLLYDIVVNSTISTKLTWCKIYRALFFSLFPSLASSLSILFIVFERERVDIYFCLFSCNFIIYYSHFTHSSACTTKIIIHKIKIKIEWKTHHLSWCQTHVGLSVSAFGIYTFFWRIIIFGFVDHLRCHRQSCNYRNYVWFSVRLVRTISVASCHWWNNCHQLGKFSRQIEIEETQQKHEPNEFDWLWVGFDIQ